MAGGGAAAGAAAPAPKSGCVMGSATPAPVAEGEYTVLVEWDRRDLTVVVGIGGGSFQPRTRKKQKDIIGRRCINA